MLIRDAFTPIQPAPRDKGKGVLYTEHLPHGDLLQHVYCLWDLQTTQPLTDSFSYRVVADGCVDIFFNVQAPSESFVMGFCKQFTLFPLGGNFHYRGIRFLPGSFSHIFQRDTSELTDRYAWLKDIIPSFARYLADEHITVKALNDFIYKALNSVTKEPDPRFYNALLEILKSSGTLQIEKDIQTGYSPRQLRRTFNYYLGTTPKTFSKVVRFQNILRAKPSTQSLRENKLFFDVGYYDQAHFIKEFKHFYGVTPTEAFDR